MKPTPAATAWTDAALHRIATPTTPRARLDELRSHLQDTAAQHAHAAGRTTITTPDLEAAWQTLGGDTAIQHAFLPPDHRHLHRATKATLATWAIGALAGITAATIAITKGLGNATTPFWFLAAAATAAIATLLVAAALLHLLRRHDLAPSERLAWVAGLILLPPIGAIAYFALGRDGTRDLAHRALNREAADT
jgi:peptidoglycan/LPS O-acetylase OafA/YrhL